MTNSSGRVSAAVLLKGGIMFLYILLALIIICLICKKNTAHYVPILMYHRIASISGDRNSLPPDKFAWQLQYLSEHNYHTITPAMLYAFYSEKKKLPPNPVLLSFDDGYSDNFATALPLLKKYHMSAVVFPISQWIGKKNKWENFGKAETITMDYTTLRKWLQEGQNIASHTRNHPFLINCSEKQLDEELQGSKKELEENLLQKTDFLCYPYGKFNAAVINAAQRANYKMAFAIFENVKLHKVALFALPRIPIPSHQKKWEFKLKVSRLFIVFIALRKWERDFKQFKRKVLNKK